MSSPEGRAGVQSLCVTVAFAVSVFGFMGVYSRAGFQTFPPSWVLAGQIIFMIAALSLGLGGARGVLRRLLPYGVLAGLAFLSIFWAPDGFTAFKRALLIFVPGGLLLVLAASVQDPRRLLIRSAVLLSALVVASILWALMVDVAGENALLPGKTMARLIDFGSHAFGNHYGRRSILALGVHFERPSGLTSNANSMALYSVLTFFAVLAVMPKAGRWRIMAYGVLGICLAAILWTFSRGTLLFLMSGGGVYLAVMYGWKRLLKVVVFLTMAVPFVIAVLVIAHNDGVVNVPGFEVGEFRRQYQVLAMPDRVWAWTAVLKSIGDWGFVGAGFGLVQEAIIEPSGVMSSAHSVPFTILGELGVFGGVVLYLVWLMPLRALRDFEPKNRRVAAGLAALIVGLFAHQCFDSSVFRYHSLNFVFSVIVGLAMNPAWKQQESDSDEREEVTR